MNATCFDLQLGYPQACLCRVTLNMCGLFTICKFLMTVYRSTSQYIAVHHSISQYITVYRSTSQYIAVYRSTSQYIASKLINHHLMY